MMADRIPSIPTTYKGIHFRSRLESRWAAFFDLVGWAWQYEPIDLDGYIPDFVLEGKGSILVEVKPALSLAALEVHTKKIEGSRWDKEAILLGTRPYESTVFECAGLGLIGERNESEYIWTATVLAREPDGDRWDFSSDLMYYGGRMYGEHDGNPAWMDLDRPLKDEVRILWTKAGNATRWQPK
jgi:hypothetical protein